MGLFDIFQRSEEQFTNGVSVGEGATTKSTNVLSIEVTPGTTPPPYDKIFKRYRQDPIIKSFTDFYVRMQWFSWPNKFDIIEPDAPQEVQNYLNYIVDNTNLKYIWCDMITRQVVLTGGSFVENLWNKKKTEIRSFAVRTPQYIDFIKDEMEVPILDIYGNVTGFVYTNPVTMKETKFENFKEMYYVNIGSVNPGTYGIGFVEPVIPDLTLREYVEQAISTSALRMTRPIIDVTYRTIDGSIIKGSKKLAENLAEGLAKFYSNNSVRSRYVTQPDFLEKNVDYGKDIPDQFISFLDHTGGIIAMSFGFPSNFGMTFNKTRISKEHINMFLVAITGFQYEMDLKGFLENIIYQKFGKNYTIRFKYKEISVDLMKEETMRLMRLIKVNALNPDDPNIKKEIASREGIYLAEPVGKTE